MGRTTTPKDAVFLFPDADRRFTGNFSCRCVARRLRGLEAGGQVNFFKDLAEEWWSRWQRTMAAPFDPKDVAQYHSLGIDYFGLQAKNRLEGVKPLFENGRFVVYPAAVTEQH